MRHELSGNVKRNHNAIHISGKYVGSFGDGPGRYKQLLTDTGLLKGKLVNMHTRYSLNAALYKYFDKVDGLSVIHCLWYTK